MQQEQQPQPYVEKRVDVPVTSLVKLKNLLKRLITADTIDSDCMAWLYTNQLLQKVMYEEMPLEGNLSLYERQVWMSKNTVGVDQAVFDVVAGSAQGQKMLAYVYSDELCTFEEFIESTAESTAAAAAK